MKGINNVSVNVNNFISQLFVHSNIGFASTPLMGEGKGNLEIYAKVDENLAEFLSKMGFITTNDNILRIITIHGPDIFLFDEGLTLFSLYLDGQARIPRVHWTSNISSKENKCS